MFSFFLPFFVIGLSSVDGGVDIYKLKGQKLISLF